jgi:LysR family transcriptional regulator, benzoate and cis,cis-muconate-responsive activator of ben and cat genes
MELRHLRAFLAVAEELHFGRAAARLQMAQPPLSQQVRRLERELGVELFRRNRRHVELTHAGGALVPEARRTLAAAERAAAVVAAVAAGASGRVSLGFVGSLAHGVLPRLVRELRLQAPGVEIALREANTSQQIELLRLGLLDAGLVRPPIQAEGIEIEIVGREPLRAVLPDDHRLAGARSIRLEALRDEPFVLFPRAIGPGLYDQILGLCREAGFSPNVVYESGATATMVALVEAGIGVCVLPQSHAGTGSAHFVPLAGGDFSTEIGLAWASAGASAIVGSVRTAARAALG